MTTTEVDNWPADFDGVMGPDLMTRFQKHAERFETAIVSDHIHTVKLGQSPLSAARKLRSKSILADFRDEQGGGGKSGGLPTGSLRVRRYF